MRRLDPRTIGHLVEPEGNPARGRRGPTVGPPGIFFKVVPRPIGMLKEVFLAHFKPVLTCFGPWKNPKCLENGPFWDHKWVKIGSKTCFPSSDRRPFGVPKQVFLADFEPVVTGFGPWKIPKCLENGSFWDQKWVKNGSKTHFSKSDRGPFGMLGQVFLAHLDGFGPMEIPIFFEKGPFWEQKWVKNCQKHVIPKVTLDHWGCTNK